MIEYLRTSLFEVEISETGGSYPGKGPGPGSFMPQFFCSLS